MFLITGWSAHTDDSRGLADDIESAFRACGLSHKAAAITMGISSAQLSRALAGHEHLSAWRLALLGAQFSRELAKLRLRRAGRCLVVDQPELVELLSYVRGRMAKATLRPTKKAKVA